MQKQAYPYCPHGVYTGGCGVDYMCGVCENGDEPLTINEVKEAARLEYSRFAGLIAKYTNCSFEPMVWAVNAAVLRHHVALAWTTVVHYQGIIAEAKIYSAHDDDKNWVRTRHNVRRMEWNDRTAEEQFWSLPAQVLEGS